MNYAEIQPIFSIQQFLITAIVIMLLSRLIVEIVIIYQNKKKTHQQATRQADEHTNTHTYYNKKIG